MAKEEYTVSDIYQGGYSSLDPSKGNYQGYRIPAGEIGMATDPRTADALKEVSDKLKTGAKQIELSTVSPDVFDSIPTQHLREVNRLSKLTGVDISVHAPIVEPSGINPEKGYSEFARNQAETQMLSSVERAQKVNPNGNVVVTFHSSAVLPDIIPQKDTAGKIREITEGYAFNTETGATARIPIKVHTFPGESNLNDPNKLNNEIKKINEEQWAEKLRGINYYSQIAGERIENLTAMKYNTEQEIKNKLEIDPKQEEYLQRYNQAKGILNSSYVDLKRTFDLAYERGTEEEKRKIQEFYSQVEKDVSEMKKKPEAVIFNTIKTKEIIDKGLKVLDGIEPPSIYRNLNDFSKDRTIETFSNVALKSYKQFKDNSPIISIENPPAGGAFGRGEDLKEIIEKSRAEFVKKIMKPESEGGMNMSQEDARAQAEKLLGVTWDVGHINMIRKYGYDAKDVVKEAEKVAPLVKHVHLSDNFGLDHTELPMGMGNVPIAEIMNRLGKEGFEGKKIIEAGNWWQHFKTAPFQETLEAFGSPVYPMQMQPYWNQAGGFQQGYFSGYGQMLPQMNYETTGAGFSQLPAELGGQRGNSAQGSRMSGRPME